MFKGISSGLSKFFTRDKIFILIALIILGYALMSYSDTKGLAIDNMDDGYMSGQSQGEQSNGPSGPPTGIAGVGPSNSEQTGSYTSQQVASPAELLPKDQNSQWAALNPVAMNQGNTVMPDLLQAGYHIGLDTIGQSLRNANLQLRSDPIIQRSDVGPWNQSTIEPDLGRVPLEIGSAYK
jgi:hypothetical protein